MVDLETLKTVAELYHGDNGRFAYEAFEYINATHFGGRLPVPLIQWAITPHGSCLGLTRTGGSLPVITLHPSIISKQSAGAWGYSADMLGACLAYDVLLHECIHVSVHFLLGGATGPTSHNNPQWISEVNRIAPALGFTDAVAGASKSKRVVVGQDEDGRNVTTVVRVSDGNLPHKATATFPQGVRQHLGDYGFYHAGILPFNCTCNVQLRVT